MFCLTRGKEDDGYDHGSFSLNVFFLHILPLFRLLPFIHDQLLIFILLLFLPHLLCTFYFLISSYAFCSSSFSLFLFFPFFFSLRSCWGDQTVGRQSGSWWTTVCPVAAIASGAWKPVVLDSWHRATSASSNIMAVERFPERPEMVRGIKTSRPTSCRVSLPRSSVRLFLWLFVFLCLSGYVWTSVRRC